MSSYDASVGVFVRGLSNLKAQLTKAEAHAAASGGDASALLDARLPQATRSDAPHDLHTYTLAAQVHWATEGARLAIARIVGARAVAVASTTTSFSDLHQRIDATIVELRAISATDIEAGLGRTIVVEHRRGTVSTNGSRFLLGYAIPHFFYHVTTAYDILRSQGVPLTMADFLGDWGSDQGMHILVVTGASGAGKTTAVHTLEARALSGVRCFHFDSIGVPTDDEMRRDHGGGEQWQAWATERWLRELDRLDADVHVAVLDGQTRPSFVATAAASLGRHVHTVLLDCATDERNARLRQGRGQPELATHDMTAWAAYLRGQAHALGLPVIDTSRLSPEAVADRLEEIIESLPRAPG